MAIRISVLEQVLQLLSFPDVVRYLGLMDIFFTGVVVYMLIYLMFPFEKLEARRAHPRWHEYEVSLVVLKLVLIYITDIRFQWISGCCTKLSRC